MNFIRFATITMLFGLSAAILAVPAAHSQQMLTTFEITGADTDVSYNNDADWGWWSPAKYDEWVPGGDTGFDLEGIRIMVPSESYGMILAWETYPTMEAITLRFDDIVGETFEHHLITDIETYDLAFNHPYHLGADSVITPLLGATYMAIDEERQLVDSEQQKDTARTRGWGVVGGVEGHAGLMDRLDLTGRFVIRWGSGSRDATYTVDDEDTGVTQVTLSDSTDLVMYSAELGLRWEITPVIKFEGGWRYRDWSYDDGPASFDGFYIRLRFDL